MTHGGALRTILYYAENSEYDYEKYMKCTENIKINNLDIFKLEEELNNTKLRKVNI